MRTSFLLTLAYLALNVCAGGYQGCLERVLLFYAYEIDGLNDPNDRKLGFKCKDWNIAANECIDDDWEECRGAAGKRCNFNELMAHIGGSTTKDELVGPPGADQKTKTPDVEETAKVLYKHYMETASRENRKLEVPNFKAYDCMKGAGRDFYKYTQELGQVVNKAWKYRTNDNAYLWNGFDETMDKLDVARAGDHGPWVIEAFKKQFKNTEGMVIVTKPVRVNVENPLIEVIPTIKWTDQPGKIKKKPKAKKWETVDFEESAQKSMDNGVEDASKLLNDYRAEWYRDSFSAREHLELIKVYKGIEDLKLSCR